MEEEKEKRYICSLTKKFITPHFCLEHCPARLKNIPVACVLIPVPEGTFPTKSYWLTLHPEELLKNDDIYCGR